MQEEKVHGKPARRRPAHPHHAPRGLRREYVTMHTALPKAFVGLSDGRIFDPRSGFALDWWGVGTVRPEIFQESGTESTEIWQVVFADGAAVATPKGIHVVSEPQQGQLRVQLPPHIIKHTYYRLEGGMWRLAEPPYIRSRSRTLRRERQCGRRPVDGTPLLMSTRTQPQEWPPPEPRPLNRW